MEPGVEAEQVEEAPEAPARPVLPPWAGIALVVIGVGIIAFALLWGGLLGSSGWKVAEPVPGVTVPAGISPGEEATLPPSLPPLATITGTSFPTPGGPPGFTVTVSPVQTSAARGETVIYHMTIEAQNGFLENVTMQLVASAFLGLKSETVDLGVQEPPYPRTIEYPFPIPADWPPGITIDGVVRSTGGGITRENQLALTVR